MIPTSKQVLLILVSLREKFLETFMFYLLQVSVPYLSLGIQMPSPELNRNPIRLKIAIGWLHYAYLNLPCGVYLTLYVFEIKNSLNSYGFFASNVIKFLYLSSGIYKILPLYLVLLGRQQQSLICLLRCAFNCYTGVYTCIPYISRILDSKYF